LNSFIKINVKLLCQRGLVVSSTPGTQETGSNPARASDGSFLRKKERKKYMLIYLCRQRIIDIDITSQGIDNTFL
jgi:hypothetical protein